MCARVDADSIERTKEKHMIVAEMIFAVYRNGL